MLVRRVEALASHSVGRRWLSLPVSIKEDVFDVLRASPEGGESSTAIFGCWVILLMDAARGENPGVLVGDSDEVASRCGLPLVLVERAVAWAVQNGHMSFAGEISTESRVLIEIAGATDELREGGDKALAAQCVDAWNRFRDQAGLGTWNKAGKMRETGVEHVRARMKDCGTREEFVREFVRRLQQMRQSSHYCGANDWVPSLPWLVAPRGWELAGALRPVGATVEKKSGVESALEDMFGGGMR